ncbi:MAG TPA: hypothetical protein VGG17_04960 [Acidimicrobiales bacterium]|jgi:hypothetical protein
MGLFRRSKQRHAAADPLTSAAEARELGRNGILGPEVSSMSPIFKADPSESDIADEELQSSANPEDDTTRELLIEREREQQEPDY